MMRISGKPGSGAQTLAAPCAAGGEDLAAAGRRKAGTKAVTALAHQFAGLISPLHGSFSADRAMMPDNEISPVMLLGPKRAISGPMEPPRSDRVIADSWRGLYGSDPFSSIWRLSQGSPPSRPLPRPSKPRIYAKISGFAGFLTGEYGGPDGCLLDDGTVRHERSVI